MSTCIIGGGGTGLATAIKLKLKRPEAQIVIIDSRLPNTQIAGQRIRTRGESSNKVGNDPEGFLLALAKRNGGVVTPGMQTLVEVGTREVTFWQNILAEYIPSNAHRDSNKWFGPQLGAPNKNGKGHGGSVMRTLRAIANDLGIPQINGVINNIRVEGNTICSISGTSLGKDQRELQIFADNFVFTGGDAGGAMFYSTNKSISHTPAELLLSHGIDLIGCTDFMIHPFGNASCDGSARIGCYQTDNLDSCQIHLQDANGEYTQRALWVEDLLRNHQAHYHFPEITQQFHEHNDTIRITYPDGQQSFARPSHHYSHMGIATGNDHVSIPQFTNGFVGGDAASIERYTGFQPRLPGTALTAVFTDVSLIVEQLSTRGSSGGSTTVELGGRRAANPIDKEGSSVLKGINTGMLLSLQRTTEPEPLLNHWQEQLAEYTYRYGDSTLVSLSNITVHAIRRRVLEGEAEPIPIRQESIKELRAEYALPIN